MKETENKFYGITADFLNIFGEDFDRLTFPADVHWIAAGCGGNGLLIKGSEKNAVLDCGMAYCGWETVENIKKLTDHVDYILCSHSHYDHVGAIPYLLKTFPEAIVCGSSKCSSVLARPGALNMILEMGVNARDLYDLGNTEEIIIDGLHVDRVLSDGDEISLGNEKIIAYESKGHTDCSMSYLLEPASILFLSESTGLLETMEYVHTPILKSFVDSVVSLEKCRRINAKHMCLPHFGMLPENFNEKYFQLFENTCSEKIAYVEQMVKDDFSYDEMLFRFTEKYKVPSGEKLQPFKAYAENARHELKALIKYVKESR